MIWIVTALIIGFFSFIWWKLERPIARIKRVTRDIPGLKLLPLIGNAHQVKNYNNGMWGMLEECRKFGNVFRVCFPGHVMIFMSDPKDIEIILRDPKIFERPQEFTTILKPWLGNGLSISTGQRWKEQRKLFTPTFHYNMLENYFEVFKEQSQVLVDILRYEADGKTNINVVPRSQNFALDVIAETFMGTKVQTQTLGAVSDFANALHEICEIVFEKMFSLSSRIPLIFPYTDLGKREVKCLQILKSYTKKIIDQRRKELENSDSKLIDHSGIEKQSEPKTKKRLTCLDLLLQAKKENGEPLTDDEINEEAQTFMFAGHDTSASQINFILYQLSKHPEVQEKLWKEQIDLLGKEDRDPTFQELSHMNYLDMTIKECQRINGTIGFFTRLVPEDMQFHNFKAPKGVTVNIHVHSLHNNPEIYENPSKFEPDRFLPENVKTRHPYAFLPFSGGSRNCIGQKFAWMEMKVCVSKLIRNYKILPAYDENGKMFEMDIRLNMLLTSVNGVFIRLEQRS